MKAKRILLPLLAAMLMAACDPGFNEEYTIDNQSSHDILFVWSGGWRYYPYENGTNFDGTYPVAAGQKATLPTRPTTSSRRATPTTSCRAPEAE